MADKVVPKKRTTKKVAKKATVKTAVRKAPTRVAQSEPKPSTKSWLSLLIGCGVFIVVIGASIAIGYSDGGAIDIADTINERKSNATVEEQQELQNVRAEAQQAVNRKPGGGLVPTTDVDPDLPPPPEPATTTASSTDETASSTDETVEGEETTDEAAGENTEEAVVDEPTEESVETAPEETQSEPAVEEPPVETSEGG